MLQSKNAQKLEGTFSIVIPRSCLLAKKPQSRFLSSDVSKQISLNNFGPDMSVSNVLSPFFFLRPDPTSSDLDRINFPKPSLKS